MHDDCNYVVAGNQRLRVTNQKELVAFVHAFRKDLDHALTLPEEPYAPQGGWENTNLPNFLEALEAWLSDTSEPTPESIINLSEIAQENPWAAFALILSAAQIQE